MQGPAPWPATPPSCRFMVRSLGKVFGYYIHLRGCRLSLMYDSIARRTPGLLGVSHSIRAGPFAPHDRGRAAQNCFEDRRNRRTDWHRSTEQVLGYRRIDWLRPHRRQRWMTEGRNYDDRQASPKLNGQGGGKTEARPIYLSFKFASIFCAFTRYFFIRKNCFADAEY